MRRIVPLAAAMFMTISITGCETLGWYRAIGHYPGIAPSDYAFYEFCGTSSQVFQYPIPQVESAALEALRDLGFKELRPAEPCGDEAKAMTVRTPDGRPATITFTHQNALTNMKIKIGPAHLGDEMLARDVFRRVALNFGTLPRDYMPIEPTLSRRLNAPSAVPPPLGGAEPPVTLAGEGLRPGDDRNQYAPEFTAPVTGTGSGAIPQLFDPYRPYYPGQMLQNPALFPYNPSPYGPGYFGGGQFPP